MDKLLERKQLRRVFGSRASDARDHERPDFLLEIEGNPRLGIEVTSIYANNADAKLKLIPGYTASLIDKTQRVHRADIGKIRVEDATLLNPDGSVVDKITGIFQEMPSKKDAYEILFEKIEEKEANVQVYLQSCDEVDLIVEDGSNLFRHETHEDFYKIFHALVPKKQLISSGFREIHLITTTIGSASVYVPLIANAFFADCLAYGHLLKPSIDAERPSHEIFQLLAACLWHDGYTRVRMTGGTDGVGFFCGAWEIFYAEDGMKLRDWNFPNLPYDGESLAEVIANTASGLLEEARSLSENRKDLFAAMDVRLPTHGA